MKYLLTILASDGQEKRFVASSPFMTLAAGDMINMTMFQDREGLNMPLRVVLVEHTIRQNAEDEQITHAIAVYAERIGLD